MVAETDVLRFAAADDRALERLWWHYGVDLIRVDHGDRIPGSFWGDEEAGLNGRHLYARDDTPVHSILHEGGHFVCMDAQRRAGLNTDAGGDYDEENGVCYLQILLAATLPDVGADRMCADMDAWGYSFRLGSAAAWFREDAEDAHAWLLGHGIIDANDRPTWRVRNA